ncbi:hypothetical protein LAY58_24405, partial [Escherichia coli]|nr:hypothetical protein [Escherichia coli]MDD8996589.1 hypothetical protein [Escherichia coli]
MNKTKGCLIANFATVPIQASQLVVKIGVAKTGVTIDSVFQADPVLCGNPPTLPGAGAVWKSAHLAGRRCRVEIHPPCR